MTQLYSTLANIYHEMYRHIFDYDKEFGFYDAILKRNAGHCTFRNSIRPIFPVRHAFLDF